MLTYLQIQGLAVIESLAIEFQPGFNIITGETGAGKSILIKALGLLLGAKAPAETVRAGFDNATISGVFQVTKTHRATAVLQNLGIAYDEEAGTVPVLIRRQIGIKSRSQAWVNDVPVTTGALRELADSLIDVFAQHENHRLLEPAKHVEYLDQFLDSQTARAEYARQYEHCWEIFGRLLEMVETFNARLRDRDYLTFRCNEIAELAPTVEDFHAIEGLCDSAANLQKYVGAISGAQSCLDEGGDGGGPLSRLVRETGKKLRQLHSTDTAIEGLATEAEDIASRLDDLSYQLGRMVHDIEVDETDLNAAEERLASYQAMIRKLAVHDVTELVAEAVRLQQELSFLESAADDVDQLLRSLRKATTALRDKAKTLSTQRHKAAGRIKKAIESELKELAMPGARIEVEFAEVHRTLPAIRLQGFGEELEALWQDCAADLTSLTEQGSERIHFLLASNPGEAAYPLHKIASGGEISRIMLALKKALSAGAETCVLVFDEIDTGISGKVADIVGRKMKELSKSFQVISISHLAQVAAYADSHLLVRKYRRKSRTESEIVLLSQEESAQEIARLLSGEEITLPSLENAKALIARAGTNMR